MLLSGTYFILYDFLDHFKKDNRIFLQRSAFLDIINTIFGEQWPVSQLEKEAIIFQVKYLSEPCPYRSFRRNNVVLA